ncbi:Hypothetical protein RG1141_CH15870 [Neorhizobium galegae bv. officinalis bv. officinalis str. HAMBI 1141]|uniref:Uncharacterized protein n=1 Tax=Neorhizobium galegae bv. officinalis bv. officinalis str. HAMBI 1141 TaxID=1028801 RepID=A0A068T9E1_NEOGA|nr:hypothetical protein [Neorhizobium galegae]CDN53930.1 Hypothetical protein RG1141_CH15870 [Neorhizobium galegae bv. officinalis bv. officinalis str. HAMBI 1141]
MKGDYINLRQGDILSSLDDNLTGWRYAFVLTADCDLWNDKFGKFLTVVPILSVKEYIEEVYFQEQCQKEIEKLCQRFCDLPSYEIDEEFFHSYIFDTPTDVLEGRYEGLGRIPSLKILQQYASGKMNAVQSFRKICELRNTKFDSKIRQSLTTMKLEHFFLNDLPGAPGLGFVAMLRLPQSFPVDAVALSRNKLPEDGQHYVAFKTGSLSDAVRYAVAQAFSNVFSRIGLATNFEIDRSEIISMICEAYEVDENDA